MQLSKGQIAPSFQTQDIFGNPVDLDQIKKKKVFLSFLRYAECAVCQLRIVEIMREKDRLRQQNVEVIAIFQSPAESLRANIVDKTHFDFIIIADPERELYNLFQVKPSWFKMLRSVNMDGVNRVFQSMKLGFKPGGKVEGKFNQIPADFILDNKRRILASKYGTNATDHIPLKDILDEN